jgi:spermidine synthase
MSRPQFVPVIDVVPEGVRGDARVEHFTVTEEQSRLEATLRHGYVHPGRYARLLVGGRLNMLTTMMSDTPAEQRTNYAFMREARGDVLVGGLGLGMVLVPLLPLPEIASITVIEKSHDVIALVETHVRAYVGKNVAGKLRVVEGDVHDDWGEVLGQYDTIYLDIWPGMSTDNLSEIAKLKRKYRKRLRPGGWMAAWAEEILRSKRRREQREERDRRGAY